MRLNFKRQYGKVSMLKDSNAMIEAMQSDELIEAVTLKAHKMVAESFLFARLEEIIRAVCADHVTRLRLGGISDTTIRNALVGDNETLVAAETNVGRPACAHCGHWHNPSRSCAGWAFDLKKAKRLKALSTEALAEAIGNVINPDPGETVDIVIYGLDKATRAPDVTVMRDAAGQVHYVLSSPDVDAKLERLANDTTAYLEEVSRDARETLAEAGRDDDGAYRYPSPGPVGHGPDCPCAPCVIRSVPTDLTPAERAELAAAFGHGQPPVDPEAASNYWLEKLADVEPAPATVGQPTRTEALDVDADDADWHDDDCSCFKCVTPLPVEAGRS
jgi:hypothetical protein